MDLLALRATLGLDSKDYDSGLERARSNAVSVGGAIASGLKIGVAAIGAAATAVGFLVKKSVDSYSEFQQLEGGVRKLYGSAASEVMKNAQEAYKTAGMSANQYMEQATSFSAALIGSLNGDVQKAAKQTDVAMRAISDNVNTFGSDMGSVQYAFQGFAKQNYTMLDNLKLGYGGTKTEMERLIDDANEYAESIGLASDLSIESFSDIVTAIDLIQQKQGITGTTAEEAMHTIEGSANMTKAAWQNLITAIGRGEGIDEAIDNLMTSLFGDGSSGSGLLANVLPRIKTVIDGIGKFVSQAGPLIQKYIPPLLQELIPTLVKSVSSMVSAVVTALPDILSGIWESVKTVFGDLFQKIRDKGPELYQAADEFTQNMVTATDTKLPDMLNKGVEAVKKFSEGMTQNGPEAIMNAAKIAGNIVVAIAKALPQILWAGVQMIFYLVKGLVSNIPTLLGALDQIIGQFLSALFGKIGEMIKPGLEAIKNFALGLIQGIPNVISAIPKIILAAVQRFLSYDWSSVGRAAVSFIASGIRGLGSSIGSALSSVGRSAMSAFRNINWYSLGSNIISGIVSGISGAVGGLYSRLRNLASDALSAAKSALKIGSPSKLFRDEVGRWIPAGIAEGIDLEADMVNDAVSSLANPSDFDLSEYEYEVGGESGSSKDVSGYSGDDEWIMDDARLSEKVDRLISLLEYYLPKRTYPNGKELDRMLGVLV